MSKFDALSNNYFKIFNSPGRISQVIKNYDWEHTELGTPNYWSISLLNTLNIMLRSEVPMFLLWGENFIQFYNDAYHDNINQFEEYPLNIGESTKNNMPEFWRIIAPSIDRLMNFDEKYSFNTRDILGFNSGQNLVYNLSNAIDIEGGCGGVLVTVTNALGNEKANSELTQIIKQLMESEKRFKYILSDVPVPLIVLKGFDLICEIVNQKMLDVLRRDESDLLGRKMRLFFPELCDIDITPSIEKVYETGSSINFKEAHFSIKDKFGNIHDEYTNFICYPLKNNKNITTHILIMGNMITEQVNARKKAEKDEEIMRMSVEAANVGTLSIDLKTGFINGSQRIYEFLGIVNGESLTLKRVIRYMHPEQIKVFRKVINNSVATGGEYSGEIQLFIPPNYPERWVKLFGKIYIDKHTCEKQFSGLMIDITDQKMDDRRKNDFIGMASHELKTPITSLNGYLQLLNLKLSDGDLDFQLNLLEKSINQISKMKRLINGFLSVSRLESGKIQLVKTSFNFIALVEEVILELKMLLNKHILIKNYTGEMVIYADYDKMFSVMSNLIINAVKYSKIGAEIKINILQFDDFVELNIIDQGIGIDQSEIENLFDRFYRSENSAIKHISGFGIGLYLCSEIVQRHNGKIWVESEIGVGSTFFLSMPKK